MFFIFLNRAAIGFPSESSYLKNTCSLYCHNCDNSDAHKVPHLMVIAFGHPFTILKTEWKIVTWQYLINMCSILGNLL